MVATTMISEKSVTQRRRDRLGTFDNEAISKPDVKSVEDGLRVRFSAVMYVG